MHEHGSRYESFHMHASVSPCVLQYDMHDVFLTVDLQHRRGLCLAHTVLRCAGIRPFILLFNAEQTEAVAVADFKPANEKNSDNERSNGGSMAKEKWPY